MHAHVCVFVSARACLMVIIIKGIMKLKGLEMEEAGMGEEGLEMLQIQCIPIRNSRINPRSRHTLRSLKLGNEGRG